MEKWLRIKKASKHYGIGKATLRSLAKIGSIRAIKSRKKCSENERKKQ